MKLSTQARHALAKDLTTDVSIFIKITLKSERQRKKVVPNFITGSCNRQKYSQISKIESFSNTTYSHGRLHTINSKHDNQVVFTKISRTVVNRSLGVASIALFNTQLNFDRKISSIS